MRQCLLPIINNQGDFLHNQGEVQFNLGRQRMGERLYARCLIWFCLGMEGAPSSPLVTQNKRRLAALVATLLSFFNPFNDVVPSVSSFIIIKKPCQHLLLYTDGKLIESSAWTSRTKTNYRLFFNWNTFSFFIYASSHISCQFLRAPWKPRIKKEAEKKNPRRDK